MKFTKKQVLHLNEVQAERIAELEAELHVERAVRSGDSERLEHVLRESQWVRGPRGADATGWVFYTAESNCLDRTTIDEAMRRKERVESFGELIIHMGAEYSGATPEKTGCLPPGTGKRPGVPKPKKASKRGYRGQE